MSGTNDTLKQCLANGLEIRIPPGAFPAREPATVHAEYCMFSEFFFMFGNRFI